MGIWELNTSKAVKGAWYWWWWLFFIKSKRNQLPRQLMILWSTKNCARIKVNSFEWVRNKEITTKGNKTNFDGMAASWFFNGREMIDEFVLERGDISIEKNGNGGVLELKNESNCTFSGNSEKYKVEIAKKDAELSFEMTPWNKFLTEHRFSSRNYIGKLGYNVEKIYGMKMSGSLKENGKTEKLEGSAYFQKVAVNAPALPWYWGAVHTERGDFLEYFKPNIGLQIFRKTDAQNTFFDRGEIALSRHVKFYDAEKKELHDFSKMKLKKAFEKGLPKFGISACENEKEISFTLKTYSRACWRFEELSKLWKNILYYNEYPAVLENFLFRGKGRKITLSDLGYNVGNAEHTWGKLI